MMDTTRAIQVVIARADLVLCWVWVFVCRWYIRLPACVALGILLGKVITKRNDKHE